MLNLELLNTINAFIDAGGKLNYDELSDNLDILEKVNLKIHSILITTRMKKNVGIWWKGVRHLRRYIPEIWHHINANDLIPDDYWWQYGFRTFV